MNGLIGALVFAIRHVVVESGEKTEQKVFQQLMEEKVVSKSPGLMRVATNKTAQVMEILSQPLHVTLFCLRVYAFST